VHVHTTCVYFCVGMCLCLCWYAHVCLKLPVCVLCVSETRI